MRTARRKYRIDRSTIAALAALLAVLAAWPEQARAHTVTKAACRAWATHHAQSHGLPTLEHWRRDFWRCLVWARRHNLRHQCALPWRPTVRGVTVKGQPADIGQRRVLTRSLNVGRRQHANTTAQVALVAAITQESSAHNLPYGHGSSVGVLQLIDIHGSVAWRMVIENSAGWFVRGARQVQRGWPGIGPGQLAQAVQRSAYPSAYNQWVPESRRTYRRYLGPCWSFRP